MRGTPAAAPCAVAPTKGARRGGEREQRGRGQRLLADEPLRGIAPIDQELLGEIFHGMASEGCAVVVTGHEAASLLAFADHNTWCTSGTTYELGTPERALEHEAFRSEYPMTVAAAVIPQTLQRPMRLSGLHGTFPATPLNRRCRHRGERRREGRGGGLRSRVAA